MNKIALLSILLLFSSASFAGSKSKCGAGHYTVSCAGVEGAIKKVFCAKSKTKVSEVKKAKICKTKISKKKRKKATKKS